jgi:hypothetical protein
MFPHTKSRIPAEHAPRGGVAALLKDIGYACHFRFNSFLILRNRACNSPLGFATVVMKHEES